MRFSAIPHVGVGDIRFGMTRKETRAIVNGDVSELSQGETTSLTDRYSKEGLLVHFDAQNRCEAVDIEPPGQVIFKRENLVQLGMNELQRHLAGENTRKDYTSFTSFEFGIGFWNSEGVDTDTPPKTVIVFRRNYYDGLDQQAERLRSEMLSRLDRKQLKPIDCD